MFSWKSIKVAIHLLLMHPSNAYVSNYDVYLACASRQSSCSKAMMLLLLLFFSSLIVPSCDTPFFLSMMFFFFMFFLWCYCSCFLTCQSHSSCDPLPFPPISCSFNCELSGCRCVKICPFIHDLAIVRCLMACCAFIMNIRFTPLYPNGCAHQPIWIFLWKVSPTFLIVAIVEVA